ncbi:hypothetical protein GUJ93_ZPchr0004g38590 [Zizania palustris]|uniref:Uncharacterized protein n=1 Tax=Zizania palustris TaxID=103762 RepID=A0A8J5V938_ZIZPA|nr:hypothetical protein GUJ93_ZPchr0004g38590 [Zizania palustris]
MMCEVRGASAGGEGEPRGAEREVGAGRRHRMEAAGSDGSGAMSSDGGSGGAKVVECTGTGGVWLETRASASGWSGRSNRCTQI